MTKVLMIASGKGGTGKSTVASFLSDALASLDRKVLLVELDAGLRSIDVISGVSQDAVYDLGDVLSGRCEAEKAMIHKESQPLVSIIPAPYSSDFLDFTGFENFINSAYGDFDYIVIDTSAGLGPAFKAAVKVANIGIAVLTPDLICVRDARVITDAMYDRGIRDIRLVINKFSYDLFRHTGYADLDEVIDDACGQLLGLIPMSNEIAIASQKGTGLSQASKEAAVFKAIASRLEGNEIQLIIQ
jgi:septum site-determining protein MinD